MTQLMVSDSDRELPALHFDGVLIVVVAATLSAGNALYPALLPAAGVAHVVLTVLVAGGLLALYAYGTHIGVGLQRFRFTRGLGEITHDMRTVLFSGSQSIATLALCVVVQILMVFAIYAFARSFAADLRLIDVLVVTPAILLLSALPVSFAGWGVRETVMVIGLGFIGVPAVDALAVSVGFGLGQIVVGLPGGVIWLAARRARRTRNAPRSPLPRASTPAPQGRP